MSGLGFLWEQSGGALLTPLLWGTGIATLTLVGLLVLWLVARSQGWLEIASGQAWPRRVTLAGWLVVLVPLSGTAGLVYGAQRATLDVLDQTQVIQQSCGVIASSLVLSAAGEAQGVDRVPVASLRAAWSSANAAVEQAKDEKVRQMVDAQLEQGVTADAAAVVGRWGLDALQADLVGGRAEALEDLLAKLEARAAPDGTVGVTEAGAWLSDEYVMPTVNGFIVSLFRPYYVMLWTVMLVGIAVPLVITAVSRRRKPAQDGVAEVAAGQAVGAYAPPWPAQGIGGPAVPPYGPGAGQPMPGQPYYDPSGQPMPPPPYHGSGYGPGPGQ